MKKRYTGAHKEKHQQQSVGLPCILWREEIPTNGSSETSWNGCLTSGSLTLTADELRVTNLTVAYVNKMARNRRYGAHTRASEVRADMERRTCVECVYSSINELINTRTAARAREARVGLTPSTATP